MLKFCNLELYILKVEFSNLKGKWAFLNGANIHSSKQAVFSILFRSISPLYNPLQANIFAEYKGANNETGLFSSFQFKLNPRWKASYFIDFYSKQHHPFRLEPKIRGEEYFCKIEHIWSKKNNMYIRSQFKRKQNLNSDFSALDYLNYQHQFKLRWHANYQIEDFYFQSRVQYNYVNSSSGNLFFQQISYQPLSTSYSLKLRYIVFNTPEFSSRIYAYEPDVLYSFSVPAYYGIGKAIVAVLKYKLPHNISAYFKWRVVFEDSELIYTNKDVSHQLKCLIKWKF